MLSLKEFLTETLTQITDAVVEFDRVRGDTKASANPAMNLAEVNNPGIEIVFGDYRDEKGGRDTIIPVLFDVAITAGDTTTKGAEGGIRVLQAIVSVGGKVEQAVESMNVSRVQFRLPLRLPDTGDIGVNAGERARQNAAINRSINRSSDFP